MIKKLINSKYGKNFRRKFLFTVYNKIYSEESYFCCQVRSWRRLFILFHELKEVKENMKSKFIGDTKWVQGLSFPQRNVWFESKQDRLNFLSECIDNNCKN
jgi:hypothetical protein